jgi:iron-sulfur cluster assembly protein
MITISDNAAAQIRKMLTRNGLEGGGLRIGVKAGGCSGFSYTFAWERDPYADDHVFHAEADPAAGVVVDPRSYRILEGTVLDYDTGLISRGFLFNNPHAKSSCGCGVSFSI